MDIPGKWHFESVTADLMMLYRIKDIVHTGKTPFQAVDILDTDAFGRCLVLDGKTQSTEADEHIYHEALVHPAMLLHPGPRSVFIAGGGEGGTLREVLAHKSVERVVMLDLDQEVVDLCRRYLPKHHQGSFEDPRVELIHEDARQYLASCEEEFDVMVMDLVDPMEGGPAYLLYTQEFYKIALSKISAGGMLVTQAGPSGPLNFSECFTAIARTLGTVFPRAHPYSVFVPAFVTTWGFVLAFTKDSATDGESSFEEIQPEHIDSLIVERLSKPLRFYDGISHKSMCALPSYLRRGLEAEHRIVTDNAPVFMV